MQRRTFFLYERKKVREKSKNKEVRILFFWFLLRRSEDEIEQRNPESVSSAVRAAAAVVLLRWEVTAGGEVGVVVESVAANVGVVVQERVLDFPVVGALADGEFEVFLGDGVPELWMG